MLAFCVPCNQIICIGLNLQMCSLVLNVHSTNISVHLPYSVMVVSEESKEDRSLHNGVHKIEQRLRLSGKMPMYTLTAR